jgi:hypothetical protein
VNPPGSNLRFTARALPFLLILAAFPVAGQQSRRSAGYGGSVPVGQFAALAELDCGRIQAMPGLPRSLVPLSDECAVSIPSPDGRWRVEVGEAQLGVRGRAAGRARHLIDVEQPMALMWSPRSDGFFINDGEGSGQTSRFRYFRRVGSQWRESRRFDKAASRLYLRVHDCRGGKASYANVSGIGWTRAGSVRTMVQEGVHSEGCLISAERMLQAIGDPFTGRIFSYKHVTQVD